VNDSEATQLTVA